MDVVPDTTKKTQFLKDIMMESQHKDEQGESHLVLYVATYNLTSLKRISYPRDWPLQILYSHCTSVVLNVNGIRRQVMLPKYNDSFVQTIQSLSCKNKPRTTKISISDSMGTLETDTLDDKLEADANTIKLLTGYNAKEGTSSIVGSVFQPNEVCELLSTVLFQKRGEKHIVCKMLSCFVWWLKALPDEHVFWVNTKTSFFENLQKGIVKNRDSGSCAQLQHALNVYWSPDGECNDIDSKDLSVDDYKDLFKVYSIAIFDPHYKFGHFEMLAIGQLFHFTYMFAKAYTEEEKMRKKMMRNGIGS